MVCMICIVYMVCIVCNMYVCMYGMYSLELSGGFSRGNLEGKPPTISYCQATPQNLSGHLQNTFGNSIGKSQKKTPKGNPLLLHMNCHETHKKPLRTPPRHPWDFYRETL